MRVIRPLLAAALPATWLAAPPGGAGGAASSRIR